MTGSHIEDERGSAGKTRSPQTGSNTSNRATGKTGNVFAMQTCVQTLQVIWRSVRSSVTPRTESKGLETPIRIPIQGTHT